ncbi:MAG TPA: ergothioneine biosynthesis protein EgtB [Burkholderiales bacterium]|nr:ergothioneine biosynthesis protein EgtB [Burkholderiales bacterium]
MPTPAVAAMSKPTQASLLEDLMRVRATTVSLCDPLEPEDCVVQSAPETSPAKWHLAHTTWFFETFVLVPFFKRYKPFHDEFAFLFNSYYESVGSFYPRKDRGLLTRPSFSAILEYRRHVDEKLAELLAETPAGHSEDITARCTLGRHHEQQHQELLLTDLKHLFWCNPLRPVYRQRAPEQTAPAIATAWTAHPAGVYESGHRGHEFCFDNEMPRHRSYLEAFRIASRPVTNGEFLEFVEDGAYSKPTLWLSDGWQTVRERAWNAPMYWEKKEGTWRQFTLSGMRDIHLAEPVCHISFYEADAYARWAGKRLPTETEWEVGASEQPVEGNFFDDGRLHPRPCAKPTSFYGDTWEWTASSYSPYPGYAATAGALGEYNGKFMANQYVLRGGSCVTSRSHIRNTYRNFFYPHERWQFKGMRLADK